MRAAIIGPSHAKMIERAIRRGEVNAPDGLHVEGYRSSPIYSEYILDAVVRCCSARRVFLFVPHSFRMNMLYQRMREGAEIIGKAEHDALMRRTRDTLFDRKLLADPEVCAVMDAHQRRWLDIYQARFPNVRFIFWCEFASMAKRVGEPTIGRDTYRTLTSSYPKHVNLFDFMDWCGTDDFLGMLEGDGIHANIETRQRLIDYLMRLVP